MSALAVGSAARTRCAASLESSSASIMRLSLLGWMVFHRANSNTKASEPAGGADRLKTKRPVSPPAVLV